MQALTYLTCHSSHGTGFVPVTSAWVTSSPNCLSVVDVARLLSMFRMAVASALIRISTTSTLLSLSYIEEQWLTETGAVGNAGSGGASCQGA